MFFKFRNVRIETKKSFDDNTNLVSKQKLNNIKKTLRINNTVRQIFLQS